MSEDGKIESFKQFEEEIVKTHCPDDPLVQLLIHTMLCGLQASIAFGRERRGLPIVKEAETDPA